MISRFNYTGRSRLKPQWTAITVHDGPPRTFDAELNLVELDVPPDAAVYVEATSSGSATVMRLDFGTVGQPRVPADRTLGDISGEHVIFSVKVVDRSQHVGRILGLAEGIRPARAGSRDVTGRRPILPVNPVDLGQRLWRLTYREADVYLDVNKDVPDIKEVARGNRQFFALVYPEVVRQVLERVLTVEGHCEPQGDDDDWRDLWLRFGIGWHPDNALPPRVSEPINDATREDIDRWLGDVVDAFCSRYGVRDMWVESVEGS